MLAGVAAATVTETTQEGRRSRYVLRRCRCSKPWIKRRRERSTTCAGHAGLRWSASRAACNRRCTDRRRHRAPDAEGDGGRTGGRAAEGRTGAAVFCSVPRPARARSRRAPQRDERARDARQASASAAYAEIAQENTAVAGLLRHPDDVQHRPAARRRAQGQPGAETAARTRGPPAPPPGGGCGGGGGGSSASCGDGLSVNGATSCPFGRDVPPSTQQRRRIERSRCTAR